MFVQRKLQAPSLPPYLLLRVFSSPSLPRFGSVDREGGEKEPTAPLGLVDEDEGRGEGKESLDRFRLPDSAFPGKRVLVCLLSASLFHHHPFN